MRRAKNSRTLSLFFIASGSFLLPSLVFIGIPRARQTCRDWSPDKGWKTVASSPVDSNPIHTFVDWKLQTSYYCDEKKKNNSSIYYFYVSDIAWHLLLREHRRRVSKSQDFPNFQKVQTRILNLTKLFHINKDTVIHCRTKNGDRMKNPVIKFHQYIV